jgi:pSer/pThr/pTyr-binding forkhead associated (FHA) protein
VGRSPHASEGDYRQLLGLLYQGENGGLIQAIVRSFEKMFPGKKRPTKVVDMAKLMSSQGVEPLVLSQLGGPGGPRKVRVLPLEEAVLGRDDDCQLILDYEPVSRKHAKVLYQDYQPELLDLGSTNGTFLNGKKIHRAYLKQGDQIQVGANAFEVLIGKEYLDTGPDSVTPANERRLQSLINRMKGDVATSAEQSSAISGSLSEIHLASLLQIIESDRGTGTLVILLGGREGKLHIHQGEVRHATLGRTWGVKALYRLMALEDGHFEFFIPGRSPEYHTVEGNLQRHLLEAVRQKDEFAVYRKQLPSGDTRLVFNPDMLIGPSKVPAAAFEVMASVSRHHTVGEVIESCRLPDVEVCRILLVLLKHKLLLVESKGAGKTPGAK